MDRGYICLWRKLRDSDIMKHAELLQVFIALLLESEDSAVKRIVAGVDVVTINPGEVLINYDIFASRLNLKLGHLALTLSILEHMNVISHKPLHYDEYVDDDAVDAVITIKNWNMYQPPVFEREYLASHDNDNNHDAVANILTLEGTRDDQ